MVMGDSCSQSHFTEEDTEDRVLIGSLTADSLV